MAKPMPKRTQKHIKELASQGKSTREIARILLVSQSTIARVSKKHRESTPPISKGRPRILGKQDEKYICRLATTGKCFTATTIQHELKS
jgi:transposase